MEDGKRDMTEYAEKIKNILVGVSCFFECEISGEFYLDYDHEGSGDEAIESATIFKRIPNKESLMFPGKVKIIDFQGNMQYQRGIWRIYSKEFEGSKQASEIEKFIKKCLKGVGLFDRTEIIK